MLDQALAHLIASAEVLSASLLGLDREPSPSGDAWSDEVDDKFRRQGFTL
jgi:hypothetical protein